MGKDSTPPKKMSELSTQEIVDQIDFNWVRCTEEEYIGDVTFHCLSKIGVLQGELFFRGASRPRPPQIGAT